MGTVEIFEHTADVGLKVRGKDLDDLFRTAAEGVFDYIVVNRNDVLAADHETVALNAENPTELLALWLNELLFRFETKHRLYSEFDVRVDAQGTALQAQVGGEAVDRERHVLDHEVKAVTHHALNVRRDGKEWVVELILDI